MFLFAQPFSLGDVSGGSRILRSVFDDAPVPVASLCTAIKRESFPTWKGQEHYIHLRPKIGRLEFTRFAHWGGIVELLYRKQFKQKLIQKIEELQPTGMHVVPHSWGDFAVLHEVCQEMKVPVHISIHDDFRHTAANHLFLRSLEVKLAKLWNAAQSRTVISTQMGEELCKRYGNQKYILHTDGAKPQEAPTEAAAQLPFRLFFMGMFINSYKQNFSCLLESLEKINAVHPQQLQCTLKARTVGLKLESEKQKGFVEILPFADHATVLQEAKAANLLYMPLPFGSEHEMLNRFSLSTKMISYLASGVPILYHGPRNAAAAQYLEKEKAAIMVTEPSVASMVERLNKSIGHLEELRSVTRNALRAACRDFDPAMLKNRFWSNILN